jgi:hypothetical protein
MEAEYIALSDASLEAKYIQNILKELWPSTEKFTIFTDSEAARKVATGTGQVRKVKHLETRITSHNKWSWKVRQKSNGYHLQRTVQISSQSTLE